MLAAPPCNRTTWPALALVLLCPFTVLGAEAAPADGEKPAASDSFFASLDPRPYLTFRLGPAETRVGGRFVLDATKYTHAARRSRVQVEDARLRSTGSVWDLTWRVEADLLGRDTPRHLYEAWAAWRFGRALRVSAGQLRVGLGSEFATERRDLPFAGYSFPSYLDGRHDIGVRLDGDLIRDVLFYEATATLGKGFGVDGHRRDSPLYALRAIVHPLGFLDDKDGWLVAFFRGVYVGGAVALLDNVDDPLVIATPHESPVIRTPDLDARGGQSTRLEVGSHVGPFRLGGESVNCVARDVLLTGVRDDLDQLGAYHVSFAWNLTGQEQAFRRGRWAPGERDERCTFFPFSAIPGRLEASVRYSNADIDRDLWNHGITNYAVSTQEVRTFSAFLSWSPVDDRDSGKLRFSMGCVRTIADHEIASLGFANRGTSCRFRIELDL